MPLAASASYGAATLMRVDNMSNDGMHELIMMSTPVFGNASATAELPRPADVESVVGLAALCALGLWAAGLLSLVSLPKLRDLVLPPKLRARVLARTGAAPPASDKAMARARAPALRFKLEPRPAPAPRRRPSALSDCKRYYYRLQSRTLGDRVGGGEACNERAVREVRGGRAGGQLPPACCGPSQGH